MKKVHVWLHTFHKKAFHSTPTSPEGIGNSGGGRGAGVSKGTYLREIVDETKLEFPEG